MGIYNSFMNSMTRFGNFGLNLITGRKPLINDPAAIIYQPFGRPKEVNYSTLWGYFRESPESQICFQIINNDTISDGWSLVGGRNAKKNAEEFLQENHAEEQFSAWLYDRLVTGDGYLYMRKHSEKEVKSFFANFSNNFDVIPLEYKSKAAELMEMKFIHELKAKDENPFRPISFQYLPSSTIKIRYDAHGDVTGYVQRVGAKLSEFLPEEVIHWRYLTIDGKIYGYTPFRSLETILDSLGNIKDLAKNNTITGETNAIYNLPEESPDSNTFKAFQKKLGLYQRIKDRSKILTIAGKFERIPTNKSDDMDFSKLSRYFTQILVNVFQIPASRLPGLLFEKGIKGGDTEEGYWRFISHIQNEMENHINMSLLKKYNVELKFNRTYKQDEVRETTVLINKVDFIEKTQKQYASFGKRLTEEKINDILGLKEKDLEKGEIKDFENKGIGDKSTGDMDKSDSKIMEDRKRQETQKKNSMGMK